ncbi:uncharacterized protein (DUF2252 family) [Arthrobacter sp. CAN_A2]|uniref:DUF2252 domain-containing protein n=1 Tax=Arthrobacter sp. CAN_A2 TaxID=2787718 RepID=UPI0018EFF35F
MQSSDTKDARAPITGAGRSTAPGADVGKDLRRRAPRRSHREWSAPSDRVSPVEILRDQEKDRVPGLIPFRHERMAASPFGFFRGAAAIMAADLRDTPTTGLNVQLCGDAHISNFGGFASPERRLVFDINDFDETLPGPWEWDVKRLVTSVEIAARDHGFAGVEGRTAVLETARAYREAMGSFAAMTPLDVWYTSFDVRSLLPAIRKNLGGHAAKEAEHDVAGALSRTSARAARRLTEVVDGRPRIIDDPPLVVPLHELLPGLEAQHLEEGIRGVMADYRQTLSPDRQPLLDHYEYQDVARKVVGVGSVGTLSWIVLLVGREHADPLVLQLKQADASVLEIHLGPSRYSNHGERVVQGQRLIQASSDILLGWLRTTGIDGVERDFYVRQLWDWKTSADLTAVSASRLMAHARLCAWTLARAHARTGAPTAIASYLGSGAAFDHALATFAAVYADQNQRDYEEFTRSLESVSGPGR